MTYFDKLNWQNMQQEPADELMSIKGHKLYPAFILVVPPFEGDLAVLGVNYPVVRDSHSVGILAEILQDLFRTGKRWFTVNDPVYFVKGIN